MSTDGVAKRIGENLLNEKLKELLNTSSKVFPITQEMVDNNLNPNNYEYGRIGRAIYIWIDGKWEYLVAETQEVHWADIIEKPLTYKPSAHMHVQADIRDLDIYSRQEVNEILLNYVLRSSLAALLDTKVDKEEGKGLSEEDFTAELKLRLLSLSDQAGVDYEAMLEALNAHTSDNTRHVTQSLLDAVATIPDKVDKSTFQGHTSNSNIHVTQSDKDKWNSNTAISLVNNLDATEPGKALDALQGATLKNIIDNLQNDMSSQLSTINTNLQSVQADLPNKIDKNMIQDNLTTIDKGYVLDASRGKELKSSIDNVWQSLQTTNNELSKKMDITGGYFTGDVDMNGHYLEHPVLGRYMEKITNITTGSIDCTKGNIFVLTPSASTTIQMSRAPSTNVYSLTLFIRQRVSVSPIIFPSNIYWNKGDIPDVSKPMTIYCILLTTIDAGSSWLGWIGGEFNVS